jgi:pimeloyl-ACP methyl ester carboxylesterase
MHISAIILSSLALAASEATAAAIPKHNYTCTSFMIRVPVNNATVIVPPFPAFPNEYAATALANQITIRTPSTPKVNLTTLTKTFDISAEYCTPAVPGARASTLQILSHGLGFNRSYWDFYLPSKPGDARYSYINSATSAGYSTLSYNRLGIEPSTIADPYNEIQGFVETALLISLTTLVRAGNVTQVPVPKKVIHVGHSYGSEISVALAAFAPELSDGLVLTGYSGLSKYANLFVASTAFHLASNNAPARFPAKKYSSGFLTWGDKLANHYTFLVYPNFDPAVLERSEATKYPFTVGEFLSLQALPVAAPDFPGPVLYLDGQADLIFCASNCTGLYGEDSVAVQGFNGSKSVETYLQPNTGHGINLHYNATGAYNVILNWAQRHGF